MCRYCAFTVDSCGGFNTRRFSAPLCVATKGIKADCKHLMRTTCPDARVGAVDSLFHLCFYTV